MTIKRNSREDKGRPLEYQAWDSPLVVILLPLTIITLLVWGLAALFL